MSKQMPSAVETLRDPRTIRARAHELLELGDADQLTHFKIDRSRFDAVCALVLDVIKKNYPDLQIPYHSRWRHFDAGDVDRCADLDKHLRSLTPQQRCTAKIELAIVSVLVDAGAGPQWSYEDPETKQRYARSEGLAVASFNMYIAGFFSDDSKTPWRVDSKRLQAITVKDLATAFQVDPTRNPMVGLEGRSTLLKNLGRCIEKQPQFFPGGPRLGYLGNYFMERANKNQKLAAKDVLGTLLQVFAELWPGRIVLQGENLGDVWPHSKIAASDETRGLMPFHKLSQWLAYSLFEPLEETGVEISGIDELTGLPEYRNGGLLVDAGLLIPKNAATFNQSHTVDSEFVVEWRALTVALLDEIGVALRQQLRLSSDQFPLAKVLQGGTWAAGRLIASQKRSGGLPPFNIESDGTVF